MTDRVTAEKRSEIMRAVRSKHTGPEMLVRSAAHRLGLRFRLHPKDLPGRPDMVFRRHSAVVFVNGCYWHHHSGCKKASTPGSNREFWLAKFASNKARDERNRRELVRMGWRVIVIWQCEASSLEETMHLLSVRFSTRR